MKFQDENFMLDRILGKKVCSGRDKVATVFLSEAPSFTPEDL